MSLFASSCFAAQNEHIHKYMKKEKKSIDQVMNAK